MIIGDIFHVAIRASDLDTSVGFYCEALGLRKVPRPAELTFSGAWLAAPQSERAAVHVYAQAAAADGQGIVATGNDRGTVDHIAFRARGFSEYRGRLVRLGLGFREQHLSGSPIWQIFVHDPNGIKIELSFNEAEETDLPPALESDFLYSPSERFFCATDYTVFRKNATDVSAEEPASR